jgi:hypothetical protein
VARATWAIGLVLSGCGSTDLSVRLAKPWSDESPGVAVALAASSLLPLAGTPVVIGPDQALDLDFPDEAFDLYLAQHAPVDGPDLEACGARIGGPRVPLPTPLSSWRLNFDPEAGPSGLEPTPFSLDVRYNRCDPSPTCNSVRQDYRVLPWTGLGVTHLIWLPGGRWFLVAGPWLPEQPPGSRIGFLLDDGTVVEIGVGLDARVFGVAWDHDEKVYLSLAGGRLLVVDLTDPRAPIELTPVGAVGGRLASRPDGLVVHHTYGGPVTVVQQPAGLTLSGADFPATVQRLVMESPEKMAAFSGNRVWRYQAQAGAWAQVGETLEVDSASSLVFIRERLYAIGRTFGVIFDAQGQTNLPAPTGVTIPTSATELNGGLLVAGGIGTAALWRQESWCPLATPGVLSAFPAAATSPDGRRAAVGSDPDSSVGAPKVLIWY